MDKFLIFLLIFLHCSELFSLDFTLTKEQEIRISQDSELLFTIPSKYCVSIPTDAGYAFVDPKRDQFVTIALRSNSSLISTEIPDEYSYTSIESAHFINASRNLLLTLHTNPNLGVMLLLDATGTLVGSSYFTNELDDVSGHILYTLNPPHFAPEEEKKKIEVFVDFNSIGWVPYGSISILSDQGSFSLLVEGQRYYVRESHGSWLIKMQ